MTEPQFTCEYCKSEWRSPISAAMCCDAVSLDLDDDRYFRSSD